MKVIGIKDNYSQESRPEVYMMADSSLLKDGKPLFLPDFAEKFVAYPSLVVRINRLGKNIAKRFAHRYYDAVTVGLCVETQNICDAVKLSGAVNNAFDSAAILGDFIPVEEVNMVQGNCSYEVMVNGNAVSDCNISEMRMDIDTLIEELSKYFTFKIGDILFTGYKRDSGFTLGINDVASGRLNGKEVMNFKVK